MVLVVAVGVLVAAVFAVEAKLIARSCEVGRSPTVLKALPPCGTHSIKPNRLIWVNVNSLITHSVIEGCNINSTVSHDEGEGAGLLMGAFCELRAVKFQQDRTQIYKGFCFSITPTTPEVYFSAEERHKNPSCVMCVVRRNNLLFI